MLVPRVVEIFTQWFALYSTDEKMDLAQLASFISSCTGLPCTEKHEQVKLNM